MREGWRELTLQDVCSTITDGAHFSPVEDTSGLPMASVKDLTRYGVNIIGCKKISQIDFDNLVKQGCSPQKGDVLIAKDGNSALDTVCVYKQDTKIVLLSSVAILRPNNEIASDYLNYYLDAEETRKFLKDNYRSGSAIPRVILRDFRRAPITVPPLEVQKKIGGVLRLIDDKIELNRQISQTLESIAQALFKEWFVDFNFPGATGETKESELGPIPVGWKATKWGELLSLEYGKSLRNYTDGSGPYPVFGTNGKIGMNTEPLCPHPGIIIGRKGAYRGVHFSEEPFFVIDTAFFVKPVIPMELRWAYYEMIMLDINGMDSGSAIPSTSRGDFYRLPVVAPPIAIQQAFSRLLTPCWEKQQHLLRQSQALSCLRDALLPKLMNGEINV